MYIELIIDVDMTRGTDLWLAAPERATVGLSSASGRARESSNLVSVAGRWHEGDLGS
jgi:hypothetical protein